jgi:hypothetical protein
MKRNLIKFILLLTITINGFANDLCDINVSISKSDPYLNEEIILTLTAKQKKFDNAMFFDVRIPKSKNYQVKLLSKDDRYKKSAKEAYFKYQLKALHSGKINIPISLLVKEASHESVKSFSTGSFDELEFLNTKDTLIKLKDIELNVKKLKQKVDFIGDFHIRCQIDKTHAKAYEPIYLTCKISGKGSHNTIAKLYPKIDGADIFLEKRGDLEFDYAFSSDKNFTIPALKIAAFSPKEDRYYHLQTSPYKIEIDSIDTQNILDNKNSYPIKSFDLKNLLPYLYGLLLFFAGYLSGRFQLFEFKQKRKKSESNLSKKIKNVKNKKELLKLLLSNDEHLFLEEIEELEKALYEKKRINLKAIKEKALDRLI